MTDADDSPLLGVDLTKAMIEELGAPPARAVHPITTDALLRQHMQTITSTLAERRRRRADATTLSRLKAWLKWLISGHSDDEILEDQLLDSVLHALHQLDHRTLHQRQENAELWSRAESAEAHR